MPPPSMGPHTTCHGLVHREKERVAERQGAPSSAYGVTHTQKKHFQFPKCQWTITVGRLTHWGNMRARGPDVRKASSLPAFLGCTFGEDPRPGVRERTVKVPRLGGQSPSRVLWLLIRPACCRLLKTTYLFGTPSSQPFITLRLPFISLSSIEEYHGEIVK